MQGNSGFRTKLWLALALLLAGAAVARAEGGNGVDRGGGDRYEQELRGLGHEVAAKLRSLKAEQATHAGMQVSPELLAIDVDAFEASIDSVVVISTDDPVLVTIDGKQVPREAANSASQKTIWVNRPMWDAPSNHHIAKEAIALHEYLGTMKVDRAYELSLSFRARLEFEADTARFEGTLSDQLKDLGAVLNLGFRQSFEPVFARIETMAYTPEYRRCVAQTSKKLPKDPLDRDPQHVADCYDVVAMYVMASRSAPVAAKDLATYQNQDASNVFVFSLMKSEMYHCGWPPPRAIFNRLFDKYKKWQVVCPKLDGIIDAFQSPRKVAGVSIEQLAAERYLAYANALEGPRRELAITLYNRLINEYAADVEAIGSQLRDFKADGDAHCPGDLAEGIRCEIPRVLDKVTRVIGPELVEKQKHFDQTTAGALKDVAAYVE